jgi:hypothetical protein
MKNYGKIAVGLIVIWFASAVFAATQHMFENNVGRIGASVGIAALLPMLVFFVWFASDRNFRNFTFSLSPSALTVAQSWRILGFTFVLLEAHHILPAVFAWPAGYGDMTIGVTATVVAWKLASPAHRKSFILWQVLGIIDLVNAVALGTTASLLRPNGPTTAVMTVLPLSLIPTFFVPLFFIFHVICIAQARAWKHIPSEIGQPFSSKTIDGYRQGVS